MTLCSPCILIMVLLQTRQGTDHDLASTMTYLTVGQGPVEHWVVGLPLQVGAVCCVEAVRQEVVTLCAVEPGAAEMLLLVVWPASQ